jgi:hypothetical protein
MDFREACVSGRREVLYSILIEFGIPRKLVGLIKMCLNETCSTVHVGKICQVSYSEWPETGRYFITIAFHSALEYAIRKGPGELGRAEIEWDAPPFGLC